MGINLTSSQDKDKSKEKSNFILCKIPEIYDFQKLYYSFELNKSVIFQSYNRILYLAFIYS